MNRLIFPLLALAMFSGGCLFAKKSNKPKESSAIASEVEATFRQRWMDRRVSQLVAQGQTEQAARTQADAEFREQFAFGQPRTSRK